MPSGLFEQIVLPHLDAAFTYARWLTRNDEEAEDVVQDACVRAITYFPSLRHDNARAWLFGIVRNTWYSHLARRIRIVDHVGMMPLAIATYHPADAAHDPEALLARQQVVTLVRQALDELPIDFREVIVLREIEGLTYKEIAAVANVPIGTVMSRLLRAREHLTEHLVRWAVAAGLLTAVGGVSADRRWRRSRPSRRDARMPACARWLGPLDEGRRLCRDDGPTHRVAARDGRRS
jgi:RNA polymerase sigma factor (sigma-70 family)